MDIKLEKAAIIHRLQKVNDESLIEAFKSLLDNAVLNEEIDEQLEASIDKGLYQSKNGEVSSHLQVMNELRSRYKA